MITAGIPPFVYFFLTLATQRKEFARSTCDLGKNFVYIFAAKSSFPLSQSIKHVDMLQTAASLGVLCLVTSIIYLVDFFYVLLQRSRILSEEY
jgi:hypothetical protein